VGLILGDRSIAAVEVRPAGGTFEVSQAAEIALPEGVSWDDPAGVGRVLGEALRGRGMALSGTVGLPARWLAAAAHRVPPIARQSLPGLLRLAADGAFSLGPNRVVCDYASVPPEGQAGDVLLVGALRERMTALSEAMEAAKFRMRAVTSTVAALAAASAGPDGALTIMPTPEGVEVVRVSREGLVGLRHLPGSALSADPAATARSLRLTASSMGGAEGGDLRLALWADGAGDTLREACAENGIEVGLPSALPVKGVAEAAAKESLAETRVAAGAALAMDALAPRLLPFDLLHSRLAAKGRHPYRRPAVWAACVLLAFLVAGVALVADRNARKEVIRDLGAQLADMKPSIEAAESVVESIAGARAWYDRRPPFLDALRSMTLAFPEDQRIWTTNLGLAMREDTKGVLTMEGVLTGKATAEQPVLVVLDALAGSGEFADVKLLYLQETRGAAEEHSFSIKFAYTGAE
jgi:hypothetical protein